MEISSAKRSTRGVRERSNKGLFFNKNCKYRNVGLVNQWPWRRRGNGLGEAGVAVAVAPKGPRPQPRC